MKLKEILAKIEILSSKLTEIEDSIMSEKHVYTLNLEDFIIKIQELIKVREKVKEKLDYFCHLRGKGFDMEVSE